MSLLNRQPRPLKRDSEGYRDDRLFIVACDDTYAPKQYFNFFRISRVQVYVIGSQGGQSGPHHVLDRLLSIDHEDDDERWMLLDTDHYIKGEHLRGFVATIREAHQKGIKVGLSRPCFEIWLLLHHVTQAAVTGLTNAEETEAKLRSVLGEYNKTRLKEAHYPIEKVADAIIRAEELDAVVGGGEIPKSSTSRVYLLWRAVISSALPAQLPRALAALRS